MELVPRRRDPSSHRKRGSCNIATSPSWPTLLKQIPSKWIGRIGDSLNGVGVKEVRSRRLWRRCPKKASDVQIKGKATTRTILRSSDWKPIFHELEKDGYKGKIGLETHIFGDGRSLRRKPRCGDSQDCRRAVGGAQDSVSPRRWQWRAVVVA